MSKNNHLHNRLFVAVFVGATGLALLCQAANNIAVHFALPTPVETLMIADKDPPSDPGKDITDDPHGPDPHGDSPHGEVHDPKLPANQVDVYGNKKK